MRHRERLIAIGLVLIAVGVSNGAEPARPDLTVEAIFASADFDDQSFSARWLDDGSAYVTLEAAAGGGAGRDIVAWDPASGERTVLVPASQLAPSPESSPLPIDGFQFSRDRSLLLLYTNSRRVWRQNTRGDYWVLDRSARTLHRLGGDAPPSSLMFAQLSPTARHAAYVRDNNLYLEDLRSGEITPLTDSGTADVINGTFDWVYEEEFGLRDGFDWSPDGSRIAYWQLDTRGVQEFTLVDNTAGLYPRLQRFKYPKAGQQNSACRLGVVDLANPQTRWMEIPGDPRDHYLPRMQWAESSGELLVQQMNRLQNTNRVLLVDAISGRVSGAVVTERDEAWVDVHDELFWLDQGRRFTWVSDRDGWRHVYLVSRSGEAVQLATPGEFDVIRLLHVDVPRGWMYLLASPDNPTQRYLYRVRLDGSGLQRVTPSDQAGMHSYDISPGGEWAIHRWSSFDTPGQVELIQVAEHKPLRALADNQKLRQRLAQLRPVPGELFRVDIGDGVQLDAWCLKPPDFDPQKKYPLLIYVYGEPAGQTVLDHWGGKGYLWHRLLAERGYVVMSFDNRGTPAPRGRAWRKSIYRQVGILAPADQAAALKKVLAERPYLDPQRVGIWGWSGGGSMSLNAIFKYPELYHTAMAVAPVANQRLYDTIYQERYMGLPEDNVDGYLQGSPVNFARQLEGHLLIVHGTGDDNCHYQATETLIDELIRHNKPFTMMAYPNRSHAIREGANTSRHLRQLLTGYLVEHLPPGPK